MKTAAKQTRPAFSEETMAGIREYHRKQKEYEHPMVVALVELISSRTDDPEYQHSNNDYEAADNIMKALRELIREEIAAAKGL